MNTTKLREIQTSGTSHDVIDAIITYLEEREAPTHLLVPEEMIEVAEKVVKAKTPKVKVVKKTAKRG